MLRTKCCRKHKSKQAAANGVHKDGSLSRPVNLQELPDIMHQANGDSKFISDVNRCEHTLLFHFLRKDIMHQANGDSKFISDVNRCVHIPNYFVAKKVVNQQELPDIMHQANGDSKFISDVNRCVCTSAMTSRC